MRPRLSVALCTHNGARYLGEQLASIAAQTRRPDELVACDDSSSDATVEILRRFAATAPFAVSVHVNQQRLGVAENFDRAIGLCTGELIALADQDDVWHPEKLAQQAATLQGDAEAWLVFSDAEVVDESLRPLGYSLWDAIAFSPEERRQIGTSEALAILLRHDVVAGATLAFRASLRRLIRPAPQGWLHDAWIALLAAVGGRLAAIPGQLVRYRQHGANQTGGRRVGFWRLVARSERARTAWWCEVRARGFLAARQRVQAAGLPWAHPAGPALLADAASHFQTRAGLPPSRWRRVPQVGREAMTGRYRRYSDGVVSVVQDLVL